MKTRLLFNVSVASLVSDAHHIAPPANLSALTVEKSRLHSNPRFRDAVQKPKRTLR